MAPLSCSGIVLSSENNKIGIPLVFGVVLASESNENGIPLMIRRHGRLGTPGDAWGCPWMPGDAWGRLGTPAQAPFWMVGN